MAAEFARTRNITIETRKETLAALVLDRECFPAGHLHIYRDGGQSAPLLIRKTPETREVDFSTAIDHETLSLRQRDNEISLVCQITEKSPYPNKVMIHTPLHDFERQIQVESSKDGIIWSLLVDDQIIFDYRQIADFRRTEITLPENQDRYFLIRIDSAVETIETPFQKISKSSQNASRQMTEIHRNIRLRPFRINGISFSRTSTKSIRNGSKMQEYEVSDFVVQKVDEEREFAVEWEGSDIPVTSIRIETLEKNFYRSVVLSSRNSVDENWVQLHKDWISNFQLNGFVENDPEISLPRETRSKLYRLEIADQDIRPIEIGKIILVGPQYEAIWLAQENTDYTAGFTDSPGDITDRKAIEVLRAQDLPVTRAEWASPLLENPDFETDPRNVSLNDPRILWSSVAFAVVTLFGLLLWAVKKIEKLPDEST
ncbi:MAG: DUF3999 family protein [Verrucomicrobiales bacterium]|nr:DUF3999 family protein [Verrucomicrobiales bacterium]